MTAYTGTAGEPYGDAIRRENEIQGYCFEI